MALGTCGYRPRDRRTFRRAEGDSGGDRPNLPDSVGRQGRIGVSCNGRRPLNSRGFPVRGRPCLVLYNTGGTRKGKTVEQKGRVCRIFRAFGRHAIRKIQDVSGLRLARRGWGHYFRGFPGSRATGRRRIDGFPGCRPTLESMKHINFPEHLHLK